MVMAIKPASSRRFLHYSNQETTDAGASKQIGSNLHLSLCIFISCRCGQTLSKALKLPYLSLVLSATTDQQLGDKATSRRKQSFGLCVRASCVFQAVIAAQNDKYVLFNHLALWAEGSACDVQVSVSPSFLAFNVVHDFSRHV